MARQKKTNHIKEIKPASVDVPVNYAKIEEDKKRNGKFSFGSFPMAGNISGEDVFWRSITSNAQRDLNSVTQRRMQDICFYLFDTNPMAHRLIEIMRDFTIGDEFSVECEDSQVQEIIDEFWDHPDNDMESSIEDNVSELSLFGENCFPVLINPVNGMVRMSYIDPSWIEKVTKNKKNPRWNEEVHWKPPRARKMRKSKIVHVDRNPRSSTYNRLIGEVFYFHINKPINATRGRSDLLSLADWLDGHDQFLFARLERAFLLNTFIWDIECEGMDAGELEEFAKKIPMPTPGSIRAHNEKMKWQALAPKLEAQDASNEARLFKNQILGGAGFPEHWFAEGSKTTRATALEMGLPTLKKMRSRQKKVKKNYRTVVQFVIDQAVIHGRIKDGVNEKFKIKTTPITSRDDRVLAQAMNNFADSLVKGVNQAWITNDEAANTFRAVASQLGIDTLADRNGAVGKPKPKIIPPQLNQNTDEDDDEDKEDEEN